MTNSEVRETALRLLDQIDANRLQAQIDESALRVITEFEWPQSPNPTSWEFMRLLEALVGRLYSSASLRLSPEEAYAQGVAFLDRHYPHEQETGSEAAQLDFFQGTPWALENLKRAVLLGFVEAQRQQTVKALICTCLHAGWSFRCELARVLVEMCRAHLPAGLASATPAMLADSLESLLLVCANSGNAGSDSSQWTDMFAGACR